MVIMMLMSCINSCSINLNVLEEVRKLNETFMVEVKEWTECNRPALVNLLRSSTVLRCMYQSMLKKKQTILD